jgi:hypothetical protein
MCEFVIMFDVPSISFAMAVPINEPTVQMSYDYTIIAKDKIFKHRRRSVPYRRKVSQLCLLLRMYCT